MPLSAAEQYLLELINRARLDPLAEADRYNVSLNDGLEPGQIGTAPLQVLAHDASLSSASEAHSNWMLAANVFSHTGAGQSSAGERMIDAGYDFTGAWAWRENLAWSGTTGDVNLAQAISQHHEGLYLSEGHRANTFAPEVREIGLAQVQGSFTQNGTAYSSSMLTENFALSGTDVFITGVVYDDTNGDNFYSIGEGQSFVTFSAGGDQDNSAQAGGYVVAVAQQSAVTVRVNDGDTQIGTVKVDASQGNVKLDLVTEKDGDMAFYTSADTTMLTGVANGTLLGAGDLNLTGNSLRNHLTGNDGDNYLVGAGGADTLKGGNGTDILKGGSGADKLKGGTGADILKGGSGADKLKGGTGADILKGGSGADVLKGGSGADVLKGGSGADVLKGGGGNDTLKGGGGADTFIFQSGDDKIKDFQNNVDTIAVDRALLNGSGNTVSDFLKTGEIINGNAVFDMAGGHQLTIEDMTILSSLQDDLIFI